VLIGWLSMRLRGTGWRSVGLTRPASWRSTVLLALAAAVLLQVLSEYCIEPVIERLTGEATDLSSFRPLVGNLPATLGMLALVWTLAAFGEELAYRGYVLERAATLGGGTRTAWILGVIGIAALFGLGHVYQGVSGIFGSAFAGLYFGALYLANGRNLWLPVLAHGFSDTIALGLIYTGAVPV
jgi:membrane protease YdiL (CAAX protease family)